MIVLTCQAEIFNETIWRPIDAHDAENTGQLAKLL